ALVEAVTSAVAEQGARELWLVTTNDNLDALRFYQRRGFRLSEVRAGAVDASRAVKPVIPAIGRYGIPLRDELILVRALP
ncbi:MAG: GNAT family N-acetyltransferase, partial [Actinomycetota bacterium]|nr:GNAT family N-acetyltransferase [Actinomycetota bacterium]